MNYDRFRLYGWQKHTHTHSYRIRLLWHVFKCTFISFVSLSVTESLSVNRKWGWIVYCFWNSLRWIICNNISWPMAIHICVIFVRDWYSKFERIQVNYQFNFLNQFGNVLFQFYFVANGTPWLIFILLINNLCLIASHQEWTTA